MSQDPDLDWLFPAYAGGATYSTPFVTPGPGASSASSSASGDGPLTPEDLNTNTPGSEATFEQRLNDGTIIVRRRSDGVELYRLSPDTTQAPQAPTGNPYSNYSRDYTGQWWAIDNRTGRFVQVPGGPPMEPPSGGGGAAPTPRAASLYTDPITGQVYWADPYDRSFTPTPFANPQEEPAANAATLWKGPDGQYYWVDPKTRSFEPTGFSEQAPQSATEPNVRTGPDGNVYIWDAEQRQYVRAPGMPDAPVRATYNGGGGGGGGNLTSATLNRLFGGGGGGGGGAASAADAVTERDRWLAQQQAAERDKDRQFQADQARMARALDAMGLANQATQQFVNSISSVDPAAFEAMLAAGGDMNPADWTIANAKAQGRDALSERLLNAQGRQLKQARDLRALAGQWGAGNDVVGIGLMGDPLEEVRRTRGGIPLMATGGNVQPVRSLGLMAGNAVATAPKATPGSDFASTMNNIRRALPAQEASVPQVEPPSAPVPASNGPAWWESTGREVDPWGRQMDPWQVDIRRAIEQGSGIAAGGIPRMSQQDWDRFVVGGQGLPRPVNTSGGGMAEGGTNYASYIDFIDRADERNPWDAAILGSLASGTHPGAMQLNSVALSNAGMAGQGGQAQYWQSGNQNGLPGGIPPQAEGVLRDGGAYTDMSGRQWYREQTGTDSSGNPVFDLFYDPPAPAAPPAQSAGSGLPAWLSRTMGRAKGGPVHGMAIVGDDPSGKPTGHEELVIAPHGATVIPLNGKGLGLTETAKKGLGLVPRMAYGGVMGQERPPGLPADASFAMGQWMVRQDGRWVPWTSSRAYADWQIANPSGGDPDDPGDPGDPDPGDPDPNEPDPNEPDEVKWLRQNVQYQDLNPFDVRFYQNLPTIRARWFLGEQDKYGIPAQDRESEVQRYQLKGYSRPSLGIGY